MQKPFILSLTVAALMGLSTASYATGGDWVWYSFDADNKLIVRPESAKSDDRKIPNGDCLEMMCEHGCVENEEGIGKCCPNSGNAGEPCEIDICCQSGTCTDNKCEEGCSHIYGNTSQKGEDYGCCTEELVKGPDPDRGKRGWLFRGYKATGNDYYGCCPKNHLAGQSCCTNDEKVCNKKCCEAEKNCCDGTCCNVSCNLSGKACCADETFGNKKESENQECQSGTCKIYTRYKWQEDGTIFEVDSKKDMIFEADVIGIINFSHLKIKDVDSGNYLLKIESLSGNELHESVALKSGHRYQIDLELINACGDSCSVTAKCQK